ncbi:peptidylprolyl isomerase fpr3 [Pleurotus ostreatus]|nr:peptidylprolyl isomerase fpr3 [Pleurotus ostreatus]
MNSRLWALQLAPRTQRHIEPHYPIEITNAALLDKLKSNTGRAVVRVHTDVSHELVLVSLVGGRNEQARLNFRMEANQQYTFEVVGDK